MNGLRTANLGTFSRQRSQFCFSFHGVNNTCLLVYFNFLHVIWSTNICLQYIESTAERESWFCKHRTHDHMCTNKVFVSTRRIIFFENNTHWKALESQKISKQIFVCFQSLFLRPPLHNSSASQAELVTDCWDERTVSWTLARWTLACHFAQLKNVCCLTHRRAISPSMELDTLHCLMRHATFVFTVR